MLLSTKHITDFLNKRFVTDAQRTKIDDSEKVVFNDYIPGVTADPSTTATSSGTAPTIAEMTKTFTPGNASNRIEVVFDGTFENDDKKESVFCGIFIDGTLEAETVREGYPKDADEKATLATHWRGSLSAASHTIDVRMWASDETVTATGIRRALSVKETGT